MKTLSTIVTLLVLSLTHSASAGNYEDVMCVQNISKINCTSDGYWEGTHSTKCKVFVRLQTIENKFNIIGLEGYGNATTNTGFLGLITLGISEAIANQANALASRSEARVDLNQKLEEVKLIPFCDGATDLSGTNHDQLLNP